MMKNLIATLILLIPLSARALENPGFESGEQGWKISEKTPVSSVVEDAAYEGKFGLRIFDEDSQDGARVSSGRIPVSSGQTVTLGFWARTGNASLVGVMLIPYASNGRMVTGENGKPPAVNTGSSRGDWRHYDLEYLVPDEVASIGISIRSWTKAMGTADLDEFELKVE